MTQVPGIERLLAIAAHTQIFLLSDAHSNDTQKDAESIALFVTLGKQSSGN